MKVADAIMCPHCNTCNKVYIKDSLVYINPIGDTGTTRYTIGCNNCNKDFFMENIFEYNITDTRISDMLPTIFNKKQRR